MTTQLCRALGLLLCLASTSLPAQWTVKQIVFQGKTPWTQADLEAASGLKPGMSLNQDGLSAAANRLNATGDFDDLEASVDGPFAAIKVIFKVKPVDPDRRYAVRFANFPWWTEAELGTLIHQTVPLFNGTLPEAGDQQDVVLAALNQALRDKQVTAKVSANIIPPGIGHPKRTLAYRIDSPSIRFGSVDIQGASPTNGAALAKLVAATTGHSYSSEGLNRLLAPWHNAGYLEADLTDIHREITQTATGETQVNISARLTEGSVYRISSLTFAGTPLVSADEFTASLKLHPGDIASQRPLHESLLTIETAYSKQGYMDVAVDAVPTLDPATHQVAYTVAVTPGQQYRIGSLNVVNLSAKQRKEFDSAWKLVPGTLFDPVYVHDFLKNNTALTSLAGYSASFKTVADPDTHLVILTMTFVHGVGGEAQ